MNAKLILVSFLNNNTVALVVSETTIVDFLVTLH